MFGIQDLTNVLPGRLMNNKATVQPISSLSTIVRMPPESALLVSTNSEIVREIVTGLYGSLSDARCSIHSVVRHLTPVRCERAL